MFYPCGRRVNTGSWPSSKLSGSRFARSRFATAMTQPRSVPPVLEPRPNGLADRFSQTFGPVNPVRVFIVALLAGYALLVTVMVFLGLFLIHVLLPVGGLLEADEDFSQWLADNRSSTQEDISWVGSTLSGGHVIPAVIGICLVTFLVMRRWLLAAFIVFVVAVESGDVSRDVADRRARSGPTSSASRAFRSTRATPRVIPPPPSRCTAGFSSCSRRGSTTPSFA